MEQNIKTFGDLKEGDKIYRVYWFDSGYFDMTIDPQEYIVTDVSRAEVEGGDPSEEMVSITFKRQDEEETSNIVVSKYDDESWDGDSLQFLADQKVAIDLVNERIEMTQNELDALQRRVDDLKLFLNGLTGGVKE